MATHHAGKITKALTGEGNGTKPISNGDESFFPELTNSSKIRLASGDTLAQDHDCHLEEKQKIKTVVDKVWIVTAGSGEQLLSVGVHNNEGEEVTPGACIGIMVI